MTRYLAVACTAAILVAFAPMAEGHKGVARETCGIKRAYLDQVTPHVRVVEKHYQDVDSDRTRVWACLRVGSGDSRHARRHGYRHRRLLGEADCFENCSYQTVVATRGVNRTHMPVAFTEGGCPRNSRFCRRRVRVVDLTSDEVASTSYETPQAALHYFDVTALGTAVWLAETTECESYPYKCTKTVRGLTVEGHALDFDEGPDLRDMALVRNRLYWMRGDEPQMAVVP